MKKLQLKKEILKAGKAKMKSVVIDFQNRIDELKATTDGKELAETDSQSESRTDADIEFMDTLVPQFEFARKELETLDRVDVNREHSVVEFGSVVITNQRNLFVSTGIEEFMVGSTAYFGLSAQAPLFKNMAGSKKGDEISFNGVNYKVLDVF